MVVLLLPPSNVMRVGVTSHVDVLVVLTQIDAPTISVLFVECAVTLILILVPSKDSSAVVTIFRAFLESDAAPASVAPPANADAVVDHPAGSAIIPVTTFVPSKIGFAPLPYDPKVIGVPLAPDDGETNSSLQVSPALNKIESPAENVELFTFAIVCHGVELEVGVTDESLPPTEST
jgi:hypothetical protein